MDGKLGRGERQAGREGERSWARQLFDYLELLKFHCCSKTGRTNIRGQIAVSTVIQTQQHSSFLQMLTISCNLATQKFGFQLVQDYQAL